VSNDPPRLATVPWTATWEDLSIRVWKLSSQTHHNNNTVYYSPLVFRIAVQNYRQDIRDRTITFWSRRRLRLQCRFCCNAYDRAFHKERTLYNTTRL